MRLALEIKNLTKHYGKTTAVNNLSLDVEDGEIFGLLGPNGAGKSTTINLVSGLCRMQEGSIKVFGFDVVKDFIQTRRLVGLMHQEIVMDNFLPIGKMLELHAGYYGLKDDRAWRDLLIERLALGPHLRKKMMELSGGMKRRFMVAKALIHKPRLLILDEPTAGVDVELRVALWDFVREINKAGTSVVLTTHYLEEAQEMCGRIGIMHFGQLVALDRTQNLLKQFDMNHISLSYERALSYQELPSALKELGAQLSDHNKIVRFKLNAATPLESLLGNLCITNNRLLDLEIKKADLEDVFLKLTDSKGQGALQS
jgi:ABC-2 type transport system ATP-binding protein